MSVIDDVIAGNDRYASSYDGPAAVTPSRRVAIVTCMDARIDVYRAFGLAPGEAHVIRNAGGIVTDDVVRSLAVSQRSLGTRAILVAHHSQCGLLGLDEDAFASDLASDAGSTPPWRAGSFTDIDADVRESVRRLRESPYLTQTEEIRGFVFEVETGRLRAV